MSPTEEDFDRELKSNQPPRFLKWLGRKLGFHVCEYKHIEYGDGYIGGIVSASAVYDFICKDKSCRSVIRSRYWIDL